jgi:hypothetical protein
MKQTNLPRMVLAVLIMIVLLPTRSRAQDGDQNFKVGDRIEYKDNGKFDLVELIKRRGVKERLEATNGDPFGENGCNNATETDVIGATKRNLGAPTPINWLAGTWIMYVVGGTVDKAPGDGYIYRKNESIARLGFLNVNGNGTYIWKVNPSDPPAKYVNGTWRNATKEEMGI